MLSQNVKKTLSAYSINDVYDDVVSSVISEPNVSYMSSQESECRQLPLQYSTSAYDIALFQRKFLDLWNSEEHYFVALLHHTSFEDGMDNVAIDFVRKFSALNVMLTCIGLYSVRGKYMNDFVVLNGLIRIIAYLDLPYELCVACIPMIGEALNSRNIECQESAIMLCETWNTKECADALEMALKDGYINTTAIYRYASDVLNEILVNLC